MSKYECNFVSRNDDEVRGNEGDMVDSDEKEMDSKTQKRNDFEFYTHCIQSGTPVNKGPRRPLSPYIFFS